MHLFLNSLTQILRPIRVANGAYLYLRTQTATKSLSPHIFLERSCPSEYFPYSISPEPNCTAVTGQSASVLLRPAESGQRRAPITPLDIQASQPTQP